MTDVGPGGLVDEEYATPDGDDIFQAEHEPGQVTIPVTVEGVVQSDEMPSELGACRQVLLPAGSKAIRLVQRNERRKRLIIWPKVNLDTELSIACMGFSETAANEFSGALLESGAQAVSRYEFTFKDEVWVRPCTITDTNGLLTSVVASTQDMYVSVVEERWAR